MDEEKSKPNINKELPYDERLQVGKLKSGIDNCTVNCVLVTIIIPVYNAEKWLDDCFQSVQDQTFSGTMEISIYNDASTDSTDMKISNWIPILRKKGFSVVSGGHNNDLPKGVGYAKNRAVEQSTGKYLCFLDADDIMLKQRIEYQYSAAVENIDSIVGSQFTRLPEASTLRFTKWANSLSDSQLYSQIYTSHGPTIIMPTWFCSRNVFENVGGFDESGKGTPEDLIFFLKHLNKGGKLKKVNTPLLVYRYHEEATTFSVSENVIWDIRLTAIQKNVIHNWDKFTIWNAGKQGRKFYRSLTDENKRKVVCFCDVDKKKIEKSYYVYEDSKILPKPKIPIVHFSEACSPFIICVKQDLTGGNFEQNLASLHLIEGLEYFHFN